MDTKYKKWNSGKKRILALPTFAIFGNYNNIL